MIEAVLQREGVGAVFIQFNREYITTICCRLQRIGACIPLIGDCFTLAGQTRRAFKRPVQIVILQCRR